MTTPAQDAPLVFPSVAFRPVRLLVICAGLTGDRGRGRSGTAVATRSSGSSSASVSLLGLLNALLVKRAVESITAEDHPLKKKMAAQLGDAAARHHRRRPGRRIRVQGPRWPGRGVRAGDLPGAAGDEHQPPGAEEDPRRRDWTSWTRNRRIELTPMTGLTRAFSPPMTRRSTSANTIPFGTSSAPTVAG